MTHDDLGAARPQAWLSADPPADSPATKMADAAPVAPQGPPAGYYAQPPRPSAPVLAIVGFALAFVVPPAGVILSIIALVRGRRAGKGGGRGLAIGGIVAGAIISLLGVAIFSVVLDYEQDKAEVRSAFERFEQSLIDADCDAYLASTTSEFRKKLGVAKCDQLVDLVATADGRTVRLGEVPITGVEVHGDTATLGTIENLGVDWLGDPTIQHMDYSLVRPEDAWLVDGFAFGD